MDLYYLKFYRFLLSNAQNNLKDIFNNNDVGLKTSLLEPYYNAIECLKKQKNNEDNYKKLLLLSDNSKAELVKYFENCKSELIYFMKIKNKNYDYYYNLANWYCVNALMTTKIIDDLLLKEVI